MSVFEFSTPYMGAATLITIITAMVFICENWSMSSIIKKHNLEYELEKFEGFLHIQTALVLTIWTFLICHFLKIIFDRNEILIWSIISTIAGIILGCVIGWAVGRNAGRKLNK